MKNTLEVSDRSLLLALQDEMNHADADQLAMIATFIFGVRCSAGSENLEKHLEHPSLGTYTFEYDPEIDPEECSVGFSNVLGIIGRI